MPDLRSLLNYLKDTGNERLIQDWILHSATGNRYERRPSNPHNPKRKRKLSAWNKYVKANSKKPRFRYRNGKLNLKKMAVAFRKKKRR